MSGPTLGREFRVLNQRAAQPSVLEDLSCTPWHATLRTRGPLSIGYPFVPTSQTRRKSAAA